MYVHSVPRGRTIDRCCRDSQFGRRFGFEHHGGLLDGGRFRGECLDRMLRALEQHHGVTREQVDVARAQRDLRFDAAVTLLIVPFYLLAATGAGRWVFRRFSPEEWAARLVALTTVSLAVSLLGARREVTLHEPQSFSELRRAPFLRCLRSQAAARPWE